MALSRWTDNSDNDMNQIIENMLNYQEWHTPEKDPLTNENLNFSVSKSFAENKEMIINGSTLHYNYLKYEYERVRPGEEENELRSSRIYPLSGFVIIYTDGVKTQYIINRSGNAFTKTILRKLNDYSGKLEVTENPFKISEDLFIWMISQVLNEGDESIDEDTVIYLKQIIGFKGATTDKLATVIGSGNRIMNLLSTLAFLFENEKVTYIKPIVEYENDTIEFSMDINGTIDIDLESYVGDFMMDPEEEREAKVILKTSLEILPKIITNYYLDRENEVWSDSIRKEFFKGIGEKIQYKIDELTS
ncbi:hypothetical protein ACTWQB_11840 [Piscibacillus sp. B03]|uniref:hypothetical protein n=1 Tax=Piscibacillus sp. B03 TaxID=3457430 RepID=UPI003FCCFE41